MSLLRSGAVSVTPVRRRCLTCAFLVRHGGELCISLFLISLHNYPDVAQQLLFIEHVVPGLIYLLKPSLLFLSQPQSGPYSNSCNIHPRRGYFGLSHGPMPFGICTFAQPDYARHMVSHAQPFSPMPRRKRAYRSATCSMS